MPSSLTAASANVTKEKILDWFTASKNYIEKIHGGYDALRDPRHMFNCDESGFPLYGNTGCIKAVLAAKGA